MTNKAFTLVELIVVVTIIAILWTIWFMSYSSYLVGVRDTSRQESLISISDGLNTYLTKKNKLPMPDEKMISIIDWLNIISYQGYLWKNALEQIQYSSDGKDPRDWNYYSYYITKNKKHFQLLAFLEKEENLNNTVNASNYSKRFPFVYWDKLWILTDELNTPIQENILDRLDINNWWNTIYKSFLTNEEYLEWTGSILSNLKNFAKSWWKFCSLKNLQCKNPDAWACKWEGKWAFILMNYTLWRENSYYVYCKEKWIDWLKWSINQNWYMKWALNNSFSQPSWNGVWYIYPSWRNESDYPAFYYCNSKWNWWRLPTIAELEMISDPSWINTQAPFINQNYYYWSYDIKDSFKSYSYIFRNQSPWNGKKSFSKTGEYSVICIHE